MQNTNNKQTSRTVALLVATITSFQTPFLLSSVNVALKSIAQEFSLSAVLLGWVSTTYLLASAIFLIPVGKIADIHGRKKLFFWGLGIMGLSSILCAVAPSGHSLIAFRGMQGAAAAFIYATNVAILSSVFPPGERGRVLGINSSAVYLGLTLGPTIGGYIVNLWGWRSIFWITLILSMTSFAIAWWKLEGEWADAAGEGYDWGGTLIYGLSLATIMLGFPRLPNLEGIGLIMIGFLGMGIFTFWETRVNFPLLNFDLFKNNRVFIFSSLAALINFSSVTGSGFLISLYLQHIKGLAPQSAGLVLIAQSVMMALLSPIAGRLSDRIEVQTIASTGMGVTALALFSFIFINGKTKLWIIVLALILLGTGYGLFISPNTNAILGSVEKRFYGVATAIMGTVRLIGQVFSIGIATLVFALYLGDAQITPDVYPQFLASLKPIYIIFTGLSILGILASLARGKTL